jgi:ribosomal-protein-alanine N-acetyltransferase
MKLLPRRFEMELKGIALKGRPYRLADLKAVMAMEHLCFSAPWSEGMLRGEADPRDYAWNLVVDIDGELNAFFFVWTVLDEMHLLNLAVHPDWRRLGVGGALLDYVIAQGTAAGYRSLSLEVREANLPARQLYASRGFFQLARRDRYYPDNGEDALVLALDLIPPEEDER